MDGGQPRELCRFTKNGKVDARPVCNIDLDPACMDKLVWDIDCKALSNHLGGWCSLPFSKYIVLFGRPSNAHFFGHRVAEGLRALIALYWRQLIERGSRGCSALVQPAVRPSDFVAWLGVFQAPLNFSKANAQRPVSNENPLGPQQYPAVFFLTQAQHTSLVKSPMPVSAAIMGRAAKNPNEVAELLGHLCKYNPHTYWQHNVSTIAVHRLSGGSTSSSSSSSFGGSNYMQTLMEHYAVPNGTQLIEVDGSYMEYIAGGLVIMVCLKIMVAGSRPWWVQLEFCRLLAPCFVF